MQVVYTVDPGKKHKVTEVKLEGNKYFDNSTLEDVLRVKKADAYQRSGRYSAQLVAADVNSIEALYRANGFERGEGDVGCEGRETMGRMGSR